MADFPSKRESLFSHLHPHPLVLTDSPTSIDCSGCGKSFLESVSYYSCSDGCCFYLHERCAELPRNISHPTHSQHLLTLHREPPNRCSYFDCDICGKFWQYFTYYCSLCEFKIDTDCAFIQEWTITNASHDHDLNLLMKPSLFLCNACGQKREDKSYQCTKCQYWIHYTCALSPVTLGYTDHHHPLTLAYKLPRSFSSFSPVCNVCDKAVTTPYWYYFCAQDCRYYVHLKCATLNPSDTESNSVTTEEELQPNLNLMHFPMDNPLDVISHFVEEICLADNKATTTTTTKLDHFGHNHLLQLCNELNNETESDKRMPCKVCVLPISAPPYYNCADCNFSIHKFCGEIPREVKVKHGCNLNHTLFQSNGFFCCNVCDKPFVGFSLNCFRCDVSYDVNCAALINYNVQHEAHKHHPLFPTDTTNRIFNNCNACGLLISGERAFLCGTCEFKIHVKCAMLPRTVKHRWDKHPFVLSYPPFINYPGDFYCEYCEEEIDPQLWLYHCIACDQSFHLTCLPQAKELSNLKYEGTFRVPQHSHPLTYVENSENEYQCNICDREFVCFRFFECQPCNFYMCDKCIKDPNSRTTQVHLSA